jgi:hypothetical protein
MFADWINKAIEWLANPKVSYPVGAVLGWFASSYFKPLFGELGKHHAERIKIRARKKDREKEQTRRNEHDLDAMETVLVGLVNELEDSQAHDRNVQGFAHALVHIRTFFEAHNLVKQIPQNRSFLRDFTSNDRMLLVTRGLAENEIPGIIAASHELRIRVDRPIGAIRP